MYKVLGKLYTVPNTVISWSGGLEHEPSSTLLYYLYWKYSVLRVPMIEVYGIKMLVYS